MTPQRLELVKKAGYCACLSAYGGSNVAKVDRFKKQVDFRLAPSPLAASAQPARPGRPAHGSRPGRSARPAQAHAAAPAGMVKPRYGQ